MKFLDSDHHKEQPSDASQMHFREYALRYVKAKNWNEYGGTGQPVLGRHVDRISQRQSNFWSIEKCSFISESVFWR
jgi:hypothetical protein